MRRPRVGETVAVATAAAVFGLAATSYDKLHSNVANEKKISWLMHRTAIKAGEAAVATAIADGGTQAFSRDKSVRGGIEVFVTASDGEKTYEMLAGMMTKQDGEPDPSTTYEVLVDEYSTGSILDTETVILGGGALGGDRWSGDYREFSPSNQKQPKFEAATYSDPNIKVANDIAGILKLEAGMISTLPPGENSPAPENTIIV